MIDESFWLNRRVFITGHTGFKGSWLSMWLHSLGAKITGFALPPPTDPSLYELCGIEKLVDSVAGDIRDYGRLGRAVSAAAPEVVFHMAAQPLVRESYRNPLDTYRTNVIGTANLLEAVRNTRGVNAVVNVTSDKCYENKEWLWGYRETDRLGGFDPYSSSKACAELVTSSYRDAFFRPSEYRTHGVAVASARSGNVIGGGDWAEDRLVPDCVRALLKKEKIVVRNPGAVRPWQHVLEPLCGYLVLAQKLCEDGPAYSEAWNFGPRGNDIRTVEWIVRKICEKWDRGTAYKKDKSKQPHEMLYLKLDCSKAESRLGWHPRWNLDKAIDKVVEWTRAYAGKRNAHDISLRQITEYMAEAEL